MAGIILGKFLGAMDLVYGVWVYWGIMTFANLCLMFNFSMSWYFYFMYTAGITPYVSAGITLFQAYYSTKYNIYL